MPRYYGKFPLDAYAVGPFTAADMQDARQWLREFEGVCRLPKGTEIWEADAALTDPKVAP